MLAAQISLLTPVAGLIALAALVPLGALFLSDGEARRLRSLLRLPEPSGRTSLPVAVGIVACALLLGLAAAQPVLAFTDRSVGRKDAEVLLVFDISRSMLATQGANGTSRFARAKVAGSDLRVSLADLPVGIASFTDRTLPHLYPTTDAEVFNTLMARTLGIERPPSQIPATRTTSLEALATLASGNLFSPEVRKRVAVVFTDGESRPFNPAVFRTFRFDSPANLLYVHLWHPAERIYDSRGRVEAEYQPDGASIDALNTIAAAGGGRVFAEQNLDEVAGAVRSVVGQGRTEDRGNRRSLKPLAGWAVLLAFVPLGFVLLRRNV